MASHPPLNRPAIERALRPPWTRIEVVDEIASTNAALLEDVDAPDGSVLVGEFQSAGRGRLERDWVSPPSAGLTFSVLVRPTSPPETWSWLPLLAGLAAADGIGEVKWPNDLLCNGRKVGGILTQARVHTVVIGIGINVTTTAAELPVPEATSLAIEGRATDRTELLVGTLGRLGEWYQRWAEADGDAEASGLRAAYRAACATLGQRVRVAGAGDEVTEGVAEDVDGAGRLLLRTDGGLAPVSAGDVQLVRPA